MSNILSKSTFESYCKFDVHFYQRIFTFSDSNELAVNQDVYTIKSTTSSGGGSNSPPEKHPVMKLYELMSSMGKSCEVIVGGERGPMG